MSILSQLIQVDLDTLLREGERVAYSRSTVSAALLWLLLCRCSIYQHRFAVVDAAVPLCVVEPL